MTWPRVGRHIPYRFPYPNHLRNSNHNCHIPPVYCVALPRNYHDTKHRRYRTERTFFVIVIALMIQVTVKPHLSITAKGDALRQYPRYYSRSLRILKEPDTPTTVPLNSPFLAIIFPSVVNCTLPFAVTSPSSLICLAFIVTESAAWLI